MVAQLIVDQYVIAIGCYTEVDGSPALIDSDRDLFDAFLTRSACLAYNRIVQPTSPTLALRCILKLILMSKYSLACCISMQVKIVRFNHLVDYIVEILWEDAWRILCLEAFNDCFAGDCDLLEDI